MKRRQKRSRKPGPSTSKRLSNGFYRGFVQSREVQSLDEIYQRRLMRLYHLKAEGRIDDKPTDDHVAEELRLSLEACLEFKAILVTAKLSDGQWTLTRLHRRKGRKDPRTRRILGSGFYRAIEFDDTGKSKNRVLPLGESHVHRLVMAHVRFAIGELPDLPTDYEMALALRIDMDDLRLTKMALITARFCDADWKLERLHRRYYRRGESTLRMRKCRAKKAQEKASHEHPKILVDRGADVTPKVDAKTDMILRHGKPIDGHVPSAAEMRQTSASHPPTLNVNVVRSLKETNNETLNVETDQKGVRSTADDRVVLLPGADEKPRQMVMPGPKTACPRDEASDLAKLWLMLPLKERKENEISKLREHCLKHGPEYVESQICYVLKCNYAGFWGYLKKACDFDYAREDRIKAEALAKVKEAEAAECERKRLEREQAEIERDREAKAKEYEAGLTEDELAALKTEAASRLKPAQKKPGLISFAIKLEMERIIRERLDAIIGEDSESLNRSG